MSALPLFCTWFLILLEKPSGTWGSVFLSKNCHLLPTLLSLCGHLFYFPVCSLSSGNTRISSLWLSGFLLAFFKRKKGITLFTFPFSLIKALLEQRLYVEIVEVNIMQKTLVFLPFSSSGWDHFQERWCCDDTNWIRTG